MAASPSRMPLVQKKRVHVGATNLLRASSSSPQLPSPKLTALSGAIYGREPVPSPPTPVARTRTPTPLEPRPHTTATGREPPVTPIFDKSNPVTQALFVKNRNKLRARVATRFGSMRAMFRAFDESGSGNITFEQFHKSISFLGLDMAEDDQRLLYRMVDTNGNNLIDFAEFSEMFEAEPMLKSFEGATAALKTRPRPLAVTPRTKARVAAFQAELSEKLLTKQVSQQVAYGSNSRVLLNAFRHMDQDGDGSLTYDELKAALGRDMLDLDIDPVELDAMISTIDADQNGYISFKEFISYFSSQPEGGERDLFLHGRQRELAQLEARAKTVPSPRPIFEDLDGPAPVLTPIKLPDVESLPGCLPEQLCKRTSALLLSPPKPDTPAATLNASASVPEDLATYFATLGPVVPPRSRHHKQVTEWSRIGVGGRWPAKESPAYLPPEDRFLTTNMEQFSPEKSARVGLPEADLQRTKARLAARHERTYHNMLRMQHNAEFRTKHASWEEKARVRAKSHQRLVYSSGVVERDEKQYGLSTRMAKKAGGASYHRMWAGSLESQFNTQPWGVLPPEKT
ncbi:hypothetical protein SDRG_09487 [Saprolegnia diclina VS20]|uniref:EF-hand domain-containing protein n=1 Tax=Saprolegnia diclina (strain VS20) TaxID=1156394 RepID=T0Q574_SAPDV|nr:hypothetical protein SDRG_09487 [Saprolegnia diclina VS20]EQC32959.1 hypothetical protein SDRG_09487 [Saprolegnia diclina VS20]|eukprot:XP_008613645.1 hypothetical protein SDRG_09487 [Saprolegnia diclina VS20]